MLLNIIAQENFSINFFSADVMFLLVARHTVKMTNKEFELQVYSLRDKLYRFANRFMDDSEEAIDIVHDTMLKLWKKKSFLKTVSNAEAYAYTLTKNICFDRIKHKKMKYGKEADIRETYFRQEIAINEESEKLMLVRQIIDNLPPRQKLIIQLRDIEELETDKICQITGLNENAIRANLSRARQKVRDEINSIYAYGLDKIKSAGK